jgi:hypothetical protein
MQHAEIDKRAHARPFLQGTSSRLLAISSLEPLGRQIGVYRNLQLPRDCTCKCGAAAKYARRIVVNELAAAFQQHAQVDAEDFYSEALCDFIIAACRLGGIALPRSDRVLDLIAPPLKVPRKTP